MSTGKGLIIILNEKAELHYDSICVHFLNTQNNTLLFMEKFIVGALKCSGSYKYCELACATLSSWCTHTLENQEIALHTPLHQVSVSNLGSPVRCKALI